MLHLNKIITIILLLLFLGCNINNTSNDNNNEVTTSKGTVNISIPNISPRILESLAGIENSRAFNFIDKIEITATKDGVSKVFSSNLTLNEEKKISIILEEGDYTISAKIYNLKVSEIDPVVSGSEYITIKSNQKNNLNIILIPYTTIEIIENAEIVITEPEYTEYTYNLSDHWKDDYLFEEITSTGKEYWYEFTPTSPVTEITLLTESLTSPPALISIFSRRGKLLNSMELFNTSFKTRTIVDEKCYVCVLPIKTITEVFEDYSEIISFKVSPIEIDAVENDNNNSVDTAETITYWGNIRGDFNSPIDSDYYKIEGYLDHTIYFYPRDDEKYRINIINGETTAEIDLYEDFVVTSNSLIIEVINMSYTYEENYLIDIFSKGIIIDEDFYEGENGNNSFLTATELIVGGTPQEHSIHDYWDDDDFFKVQLTKGLSYTFETSYENGRPFDPRMKLYDNDKNYLNYNNNKSEDSLYPCIEFTPTNTGTYYLKIDSYDDVGNYSIKAVQN